MATAKKPAKKTTAKKPASAKPKTAPVKKPAVSRYLLGIGRRKTAVARVKLFAAGKGDFKINTRDLADYFPTNSLRTSALEPLALLGLEKKVDMAATASGGGVPAQAKAVSLGIARALLLANPDHRNVLKKAGLLTRDPRKKERKKPGLKRARRAPQWQKR